MSIVVGLIDSQSGSQSVVDTDLPTPGPENYYAAKNIRDTMSALHSECRRGH